MQIILSLIFAIIFLSACAAPAAQASQTPTTTLAPTTTATATFEPTAMATIQPTESPNQIATELGLNTTPLYDTRTFTVVEDYLMDQYNNVAKAVRNADGTWRKLDYTNPEDAELMYGTLVPLEESVGSYGGDVMTNKAEYIFGKLYNLQGLWSRAVNFRFLGDWETETMDYEGQRITLYSVLGGLRDGDGRLHVARIALDAPDFIPKHITYVTCDFKNSDGALMTGKGQSANAWTEDMLPQLRVGEAMGLTIDESRIALPEPFASSNIVYDGEELPEFNNAQYVLRAWLFNDLSDQFQLTEGEKVLLEQKAWPERVVSLAIQDGFSIRRSSEDDCPEYLWH